MSETRILQLTVPGACFGVEVRAGRVADAAPLGRWMIGKTEKSIRAWVRQKGGTVEEPDRLPQETAVRIGRNEEK